jgi:hypothetical protein
MSTTWPIIEVKPITARATPIVPSPSYLLLFCKSLKSNAPTTIAPPRKTRPRQREV